MRGLSSMADYVNTVVIYVDEGDGTVIVDDGNASKPVGSMAEVLAPWTIARRAFLDGSAVDFGRSMNTCFTLIDRPKENLPPAAMRD